MLYVIVYSISYIKVFIVILVSCMSCVRERTLKCYIEPAPLYDGKTWNVKEQFQKNLQDMKMWIVREVMQISMTANITNNDCLERTNEKVEHYTQL